MPSYESPGTANMRADPSVKSATPITSPSGAGKSVGGTENKRANEQTKQAAFHPTPSGGKDSRPAGVQNFSGMARE
jgi:hypothetical protein